jgi:hypothetical protein
MAYSRGHPLMVIVESGLKNEGPLERGNEWYVQWIKAEGGSLNSPEFNGVLPSWKQKLTQSPRRARSRRELADLTLSTRHARNASTRG